MVSIAFGIPLLLSLALPASPADPATAPRVDVVFALDATGSMSEEIQAAKQRILGIAEAIRNGEPRPIVRFRVVLFRDRGDEFVVRESPFSADPRDAERVLAAAKADGGGDKAEAVYEALHVAIRQTPWSAAADVMKIVYLIGDAGPHVYRDGPDIDADLAWALENGVVVHVIGCDGLTPGERATLEQLALATEGRAFSLDDRRGAELASDLVTRDAGDLVLSAGDRAALTGRSRDLGELVAESARSYTGEVGVDYADVALAKVPFEPVAGAALERPTGLLGQHQRIVRDQTTWRMLWQTHVSTAPSPAVPLPEVDFGARQVLALWSQFGTPRVLAVEAAGERAVVRYLVLPGFADATFLALPTNYRTVQFASVQEGER